MWLEMLSLRDLLRWCNPDQTDGARRRLTAVVARMAASAEELDELFSSGWPHSKPQTTVSSEASERRPQVEGEPRLAPTHGRLDTTGAAALAIA